MKDKGFTLIEIVVALAIFAIIAVITSVGLRAVLKTHSRIERINHRLREVMLAETIMRRDFMQISHRSVRDVGGESLPPLLIHSRDNIEFTHGGVNSNNRSSLQRVAYQFANGNLYRLSWPVLDRVSQTTPAKRLLLNKVQSWSLQYVKKSEILSVWSNRAGLAHSIPKAIIVNLQLPAMGALQWVFPIRVAHEN